MKTKLLIAAALALLVVAFVLGRMTGARSDPHDHAPTSGATATAAAEFWTCSMHPQIRQPGPGKCPICAMDLVPVFKNAQSGLAANRIELSATAMQLAEVQTTPVVRRMPTVEVRMAGKIDYDETRLSYLTARFPGRLERLFVDYTGLRVNQGDHLVEIYSPELVAAQEELLQAIRTRRESTGSGNDLLRDRLDRTIEAARAKLLLWDLTPGQVDSIEARGEPSDRLTLYAPSGGIVVRKEAVEGQYVQTGASLYTIADLSHVWALFDAYESDLIWLHFGQEVEFTTEAYPGETFSGKIAFIDPVLDPRTRTVKVRVNVDNPDGRLKPEMFARAVVRSRVVADGKAMSPELAGKWISPMHPEIVRDAPGDCPVCGMDLVSAESLGYLPADVEESQIPLVIPATAPLLTGKRAVVYVAVEDRSGVFEGRVVELGPRAGEHYIVKSGLQEGDRVVSNGAFRIDSAVQILAKPGMMNPVEAEEGESKDEPPAFDVPESVKLEIGELVEAYLPLATALAADDLATATNAVPGIVAAVEAIETDSLTDEARTFWTDERAHLLESLSGVAGSSEIAEARTAFEHVSHGLIDVVTALGFSGSDELYVQHCPMAFDNRGADWLQDKEAVANPYFGARMFNCGDVARVLNAGDTEPGPPAPATHNH